MEECVLNGYDPPSQSVFCNWLQRCSVSVIGAAPIDQPPILIDPRRKHVIGGRGAGLQSVDHGAVT